MKSVVEAYIVDVVGFVIPSSFKIKLSLLLIVVRRLSKLQNNVLFEKVIDAKTSLAAIIVSLITRLQAKLYKGELVGLLYHVK